MTAATLMSPEGTQERTRMPIHLKLTPHCKSTILQLKKKKIRDFSGGPVGVPGGSEVKNPLAMQET